MGFIQDFKNYPVKIFYSNTISSGEANDFVAITTNISDVDTSLVNVGFQIKNVGTDSNSFFYLKHSNTNHNTNTGFMLDIGQSIFIECNNIADLYIKSNINQAISYQVIGN